MRSPTRGGKRSSVFEIDLPGARAVFTTRTGGVSEGPFASRNLGLSTADHRPTVERNISELAGELGHERLQLLNQVHGDQIVAASHDRPQVRPIGDGAATTDRLLPILITGADCPTVFLGSASKLIALHCGWRPVAAGILENAAREFGDEAFHAAIGPGICAEHFEVGPEVIAAMGQDGEDCSSGRKLNLLAVIKRRLERSGTAGVKAIERCTYCEPELFFSHRRDGEHTGRQAGIAWRI